MTIHHRAGDALLRLWLCVAAWPYTLFSSAGLLHCSPAHTLLVRSIALLHYLARYSLPRSCSATLRSLFTTLVLLCCSAAIATLFSPRATSSKDAVAVVESNGGGHGVRSMQMAALKTRACMQLIVHVFLRLIVTSNVTTNARHVNCCLYLYYGCVNVVWMLCE